MSSMQSMVFIIYWNMFSFVRQFKEIFFCSLVILSIEGESSSEVFNNKITKDRINCVRFSPGNMTLIILLTFMADNNTHQAYENLKKPKGLSEAV